MATGKALPFGLRQVKLVPLNSLGVEVPASAVFLPASRTFSFAEAEDFETLQGDDRTVASHGSGPSVEWELEGGGISLDVWKVLAGGTISGGAATRQFTKLVNDERPYFNVYGRAVSDSGGDFHIKVFRCKADQGLEAAMENGSFLLTSCSGTGFGEDSETGKLYELSTNDAEQVFALQPVVPTAVAISGSPSVALNTETVSITLTGGVGTPTATLHFAYKIGTGEWVDTSHTGTGPYNVKVPQNTLGTYTQLQIRVAAVNSAGYKEATKTITVATS